MPANKYALLRYRIIDRLIKNKYQPFPNKEDLREACEEELYGSVGDRISNSTIEKDLYAMRFEKNLGYYAPIAYSKAEKGYYYEDPDYSIEHISLNEEDIENIRFAAATLRQFKSISLFDQFESSIDKVLDRVDVSLDDNRSNIEEFVKFDTPANVRGSQFFTALVHAILDKWKVNITYKSYVRNEPRAYVLDPYLLKEYEDTWYLIAFNPERKIVQTFGLDRVLKLEVLEEVYIPDSSIDMDSFFDHSIGITTFNEKPVKVLLEFSYPQARYVEAKPWHATQKVIQKTEDKLQIELDVLVTQELVSKILSFGSAVIVQKPKSLIQRIRDQVNGMSDNYS